MMLRKARPSDAERIAWIHVNGWRTAYAGMIPQEHLNGLSVSGRTLDWGKWLRREDFDAIVYVSGGEILGYAAYVEKLDRAELVGLYVHPEHKRKGIGSALMAQFETETAPANLRGLWVLSQNHSAIEFYRSLGYEVSGETKGMTIGDVSLEEVRMEKTNESVEAGDERV